MGITNQRKNLEAGATLILSGSDQGKEAVLPLIKDIVATRYGLPCVHWIGPDSSCLFVQMLQKTIEYTEMQLIAELYELCHKGMKMTNQEVIQFIDEKLDSIQSSDLLTITKNILTDGNSHSELLESLDKQTICDKSIGALLTASLELGVAIPMCFTAINQQFVARTATNLKDFSASAYRPADVLVKDTLQEVIPNAFICARILLFTETCHLLKIASEEYQWNLDVAKIISTWKVESCSINSSLLHVIEKAFEEANEGNVELVHLFESPMIAGLVNNNNIALASLLTSANVASSVALPVLSAASSYLRSFASLDLPTALIDQQKILIEKA